jgi:5-methylthioadenosine/S-adenosylhomocysteine deaminase
MQWALKTRQQTMTAYLAEIGFLAANVSCGHGVWYSDRDIELIVNAGATTVHCPSSNLRLSNGIAPVADYLAAGMNVALGTDGQGLADDSDFLSEMRLAALLQRTPGLHSKGLKPWTVFEMATVNGATAFQRQQMGAIKPGNLANLVMLDAEQMQYPYLWHGHDPYQAVLQRAQPDDVTMVMAQGKIILQDGQITTVDESTVVDRLRSLYQTLWGAQTGDRTRLIAALEPYVIQFFEQWHDLAVVPRYQYNRL